MEEINGTSMRREKIDGGERGRKGGRRRMEGEGVLRPFEDIAS